MKKFFLAIFLFSGICAFGQQAPVQTDKGMEIKIRTSAVCEMCQYAIEKALVYEKGVKLAQLDLRTKEVTILYNGKKTDPEQLRKRITLTGYNADDLIRDAASYNDLPMCCKDGSHQHQ